MNKLKNIVIKIFTFFGTFYAKKTNFPVIYYHDLSEYGFGVDSICIEKFYQQMKYIHDNNYKTLLLNEVNDEIMLKKQKEKYILITFDDGYRSNYEHAFKIAIKFGLKINIFLNPKFIEEKNKKYLTIEMLKEMYSSGIVYFGSHTYSHTDSWEKTNYEYETENLKCDLFIEEILGYLPKDFCYPYGHYSTESIKYMASRYKRIFTSDCMKEKKVENSIVRGRIAISNNDTIRQFKNKIKRKYDIMYLYYSKLHKRNLYKKRKYDKI